jgi:hypothetical protein
MVSFFHVSTPLKKAFVDVAVIQFGGENTGQLEGFKVNQIRQEVFKVLGGKKKKKPRKRIIRRAVTSQSGKTTLKITPMLIPSMSIGWMSMARS